MTYDKVSSEGGWAAFRVGQGILVEDGRVLLAGNRWYSDKPLVWTLPGGRAEDGEGVGDAVSREFMEETGLCVEVGRLAYVAEARSEKSRRLFLTCAFVVTRISGDLSTGLDEGVEELRFVPLNELASYLPAPSIGDPLRHYIEAPHEPARYWFFPKYS